MDEVSDAGYAAWVERLAGRMFASRAWGSVETFRRARQFVDWVKRYSPDRGLLPMAEDLWCRYVHVHKRGYVPLTEEPAVAFQKAKEFMDARAEFRRAFVREVMED